MRKILNILQSTSLAFGTVTEESVCRSTGSALPSDIAGLEKILLGDDFPAALVALQRLRIQRGLALADIVSSLAGGSALRLELPPASRCVLLKTLGTLLPSRCFACVVLRCD